MGDGVTMSFGDQQELPVTFLEELVAFGLTVDDLQEMIHRKKQTHLEQVVERDS